MPVTRASPKLKPRTRKSRWTGSMAGRLRAMKATRRFLPADASPSPTTPPSKPNSTLSVRSCRRMRALPAPRARRTAISFSRAAGAEDHKVGPVEAGPQKHEPHCAEEDEEGPPGSAGDLPLPLRHHEVFP